MPTRIILALMLSLLVFSACAQDEPSPDDDLAALITKAEQGDAEAQYKLGVKYYEGEDVPQNYKEAARWFRHSPDQGLTNTIISNILNMFPPYDRDLYGGWIDADGDCQNTRQEVLIEESLIPVELDSRGCRVVAGQWLDAYTGQTFTDPSDLDIDHFIPLAEAHRSGASNWSSQRKRAFANDLSHPEALMAVSRSANRSKQDSDPADWLPPNVDFHCEYVRFWVLVKGHWGLAMDERERNTVHSVLGECESSTRD